MTMQMLLAEAALRDRAREAEHASLVARLRAAAARCCAAAARMGRVARIAAALDRPSLLRAWPGDTPCC